MAKTNKINIRLNVEKTKGNLSRKYLQRGVGEQVGVGVGGSWGSCPHMGVLFEFQEVRIIIVSLRNAFVALLVLEVCALLWGFLLHQEHIHHIVCHPTCSRGLYPPVGVLYEFWEVQVVVTGVRWKNQFKNNCSSNPDPSRRVLVICQGCNKDLWSRRSKYKSFGALRGCDLGVRDCFQVCCGK